MIFQRQKPAMPSPEQALPGRATPLSVEKPHFVHQKPIQPPFPETCERIVFGMGCFWGAEKCFWREPGVYTTAVGYAAGFTPNPTYNEVCTGKTGHNEVVLVVFEPAMVTMQQLLVIFWESHNPTQGMRQGNDAGTQYRSGVYTTQDNQITQAQASLRAYQAQLQQANLEEITTEILPLGEFYYAESYHQQYLAKNPNGYCGLGGTGVSCQGT